MRTILLPRSLGVSLVFGFWCLGFCSVAIAQPGAFTYQGRLTDNGTPANGSNDLRFVLFDAPTSGNQISTNLTFDDVPLTNGLFTVALDWGAGVFDGGERWLELRVRPGNAGGTYTALAPRQRITSAPYALHSGSTSNLLGIVSAGQLPANVSLLGNNIDSTEIVNGTILNVDIASDANIADTKLATINAPGKVANAATTATSANTPNAIVARDASGNFSAGTITCNFSGNGAGLSNLNLVAATSAWGVTLTTNSIGVFGFSANSSHLTGDGPRQVRVADVNRDGKPDLLTPNNGGGNISVLTNTGAGGFALASSPSKPNASALAVVDFNSDGWPDLVVGGGGVSSLNILTNDRSGVFQSAFATNLITGISFVASADFNNDGWADVVCAHVTSTNRLTVLTNLGGVGLAVASYPMVSTDTSFLEITDLNNDGLQDVLATDGSSNAVLVLLGNGSGGFLPPATVPAGNAPRSIAVADFNSDGKVDVVCGNYASGTLSILTNNGSGILSSNRTLSAANGMNGLAVWVTAADVNADGKADLVVPILNQDVVAVFTNDGSGGFVLAFKPGVGDTPYCVAAADLNGDGAVDLATADSNSDTVTVLFNTLTAVNTSATFTGNFAGQTLTVNGVLNAGNVNIGGFPILAQTVATPNNNVTLTPASGYVKFANTSAVTLNATTAIANGIAVGATLILEGGSDVNTVTIPNNANTRLSAARTLGIRDTLTLLWNGLNWLELSYSNN